MRWFDEERNTKTVREFFTNPRTAGSEAPHVAKVLTRTDDVVIIRWGCPDSGFHAIYYTLFGNVLSVCGDFGGAVYQWSERITLPFLANCHIGYFAGKCEASPHGRGFLAWDVNACEAGLLEHCDDENYRESALRDIIRHIKESQGKLGVDHLTSQCIYPDDVDLGDGYDLEVAMPVFRAILQDAKASCGSSYEWGQFLGTTEASLLLGQDCWELGNIGMAIDGWCYAHLEGLKMVYDQLKGEDGEVDWGRSA